MKINDMVYVHGYVDEIRKDTVIIRNEGGYFGTVKSEIVEAQKTEDIISVIRCKDCKHRPKQIGEGTQGFNLEFPDWKCPCQCDDPWYNWMPEDDWYCGNGERKEE